MSSTPESLLRRTERLERAHSFQELLDRINAQPLSPSERQRFLSQIMSLAAQGRITPTETRKLTKAVHASRGPVYE